MRFFSLASAQIQEMAQIQQSVYELERSFQKMKQQ